MGWRCVFRLRTAGFGFVRHSVFLQNFEGCLEAPAETGLVTGDEIEGVCLVGEGAEGGGETCAFVDVAVALAELGVLLVHFGVDEVGFDGPGAAEAPAGGGDFLDEFGFEGVGGREVRLAGGEERVEIRFGFVAEDEHFLRAQAVFQGVPAGFLLSFFGDRAA